MIIKSSIEPKNQYDYMLAYDFQLPSSTLQLQKVWSLVTRPWGKPIIGLKWIFRNKKDENDLIIRNKARLVAKGLRLFRL
ncbi:hypothetical protein OSB04_011672 [Centaurea solstitialis]|uniref:Reverse transcriptase Ty1/copia-type domain-containing protein n=1 Tax=Centaurea solstitialis TaxID=347529 RepID=A0AA38THF9_9ASTR|nr:hypothetical protein OSB04_011672 [Centaurea solstitialis]